MLWRLILDGPRDAATNMAIDEALFRCALSKSSPPTVRLYQWSKPALTIGYRQTLSEVCDLEACRRLGIDTVRRISGGRAVLHHHELTYCVTAPPEGIFRGLSVRQGYAHVSSAIRAALKSLNITVDPPARQPTSEESTHAQGNHSPALPCFAVPTGHEITAGGKKLVGSAQKWSRRGFLQHGSILLSLDSELWRIATGMEPESEIAAVGLDELAGKTVDEAELARSLQNKFEELFAGTPGSPPELSSDEIETAEALAEQKYKSAAWNERRETLDIDR